MRQLRQRELLALLDFIRPLYGATSVEAFQRHLLTSIRDVVPADVTGYIEAHGRLGLTATTDPHGAMDFPDSREILKSHMYESPLVGSYTRGNGLAVKVSDFLTQRQFERLGFYQEFLRRFGYSRMMGKGLPGPAGAVTAVTLHRSRRDFSENDCALLTLLGPHLNQAYGVAAKLTSLADELATLRRGVERLDHGLVVVKRNGRVALMTERARGLLDDYVGTTGTRGRLPEPLARWMAAQEVALATPDGLGAPQRPFLVPRDGRCLVARLVAESEQTLLLLEERKEKSVTPEALASLGLSARQTEVLAWVAEGKTNAEIAIILDASPRTVDKHVENILRKLGVETRTAAAARALALSA